MAKGVKTGGGSRKGKPNKGSEDVKAFVDAIFKRVDPWTLAEKLLNSENEKVSATVLLRLMEYRFGKPVQPIGGAEDGTAIRIVVEHIGSQNKATA